MTLWLLMSILLCHHNALLLHHCILFWNNNAFMLHHSVYCDGTVHYCLIIVSVLHHKKASLCPFVIINVLLWHNDIIFWHYSFLFCLRNFQLQQLIAVSFCFITVPNCNIVRYCALLWHHNLYSANSIPNCAFFLCCHLAL